MTALTQETRYFGRIASIPGNDGYAFISIDSVTKADGTPHHIETSQDVFIHRDDCAEELVVGMEVSFDIVPDRRRGEGTYRAVAAAKVVEHKLLPDRDPIPGFAIVVPPVRSREELAIRYNLPIHASMKQVPEATVDKVVDNAPMPRIPRQNDIPDNAETKAEAVQWFLAALFPNMASFGTDYQPLDHSDEELDRLTEETAENYAAMGIDQETEVLRNEVKRFKEARSALGMMLEENIVRRDTIIPIQYLPDLFMAVPVWYFWVDETTRKYAEKDWQNNDPTVHSSIQYFCDLFPSVHWQDAFQLFNRRLRTLKQYKGEVIPPHVARRMRKAVEVFDYVVIATPYHDQAGMDWQDIDWLRAIDPYILGFKKGIPYFFVLARYSDSGTFPLFNELVADTIEFLKKNKGHLDNFNRITNPYWWRLGRGSTGVPDFGDHLKGRVEELLRAFEAGMLFDWLREAEPAETN